MKEVLELQTNRMLFKDRIEDKGITEIDKRQTKELTQFSHNSKLKIFLELKVEGEKGKMLGKKFNRNDKKSGQVHYQSQKQKT